LMSSQPQKQGCQQNSGIPWDTIFPPQWSMVDNLSTYRW
jgi:hypothetical protein